ncbi:MAG: VanZ family protein [Bacteroidales bacterium]
MVRKIILFIYIILVTGLSLLPAGSFAVPGAELFAHADKVIHFAMYAVFTFLLFNAWPDSFTPGKKQLLPLLYVFLWGTGMEILQETGSLDRTFSTLDILANILGFFPGWLVWRWSRKKENN